MKPSTKIKILLALVLVPIGASCQDEATDKQRARDRSTYTLDLTALPMKELCAGIVADYEASHEASYPAWRQRNKESIERGREETRLSFGRSGDIASYESSALEGMKAHFSTLPKDRKKSRCLGLLQALATTP